MIVNNINDWYSEEQIGQVTSLIGNPGFGKSSLTDVFFEIYQDNCKGKSLLDKWNITCIDPAGIHYALRAIYSDIVIIGGKHGDIKLEKIGVYLPTMMKLGINFVVDIVELELAEQREVVGTLFEYFYEWHAINRRLRTYQLEEADLFISQYKFDAVCKENIRKCMTKGRMNGMGFHLVTQDFTMVDKLVLKMTVNYLLFNMQANSTMKTIADLTGIDIRSQIKALNEGEVIKINRGKHKGFFVGEKKSPFVASTPVLGSVPKKLKLLELDRNIKRALNLK